MWTSATFPPCHVFRLKVLLPHCGLCLDYQGLHRSRRFWTEEHRVIESCCRRWHPGGPDVSRLIMREGETAQPRKKAAVVCYCQFHMGRTLRSAALLEMERACLLHQQPRSEGLRSCWLTQAQAACEGLQPLHRQTHIPQRVQWAD